LNIQAQNHVQLHNTALRAPDVSKKCRKFKNSIKLNWIRSECSCVHESFENILTESFVLSLIAFSTNVYFPNIFRKKKIIFNLFFGSFSSSKNFQLLANLFEKIHAYSLIQKVLGFFRPIAEPELPRASSTMHRLSQMAFSTQNKQKF